MFFKYINKQNPGLSGLKTLTLVDKHVKEDLVQPTTHNAPLIKN